MGAWELFRIARAGGADPIEPIGILLAAALPLYVRLVQLGVLRDAVAIAAIALVALMGVSLWMRGVQGRPLGAVAITAFGACYAGGLIAFALLLRHHRFVIEPAAAVALVMYPLVLTWASDIGAYFVGRAFGRTKLMPSISPGKTRAGAVGAIVATALLSLIWVHWVLGPVAQLGLSAGLALVFGVVVSLAAQVGDLFESMLKREAGVKDSSHLLPGHGGVLDRLDSLYFVLPLAWLLLDRLLVPAPR